MSPKTAGTNEALLRVTGASLLGPVLSRVVGMLVARAECPIDTLDDALLLTDAIAAHAPAYTGAHTNVKVATSPRDLELHVGPLDGPTAKKFVQSSTLPDVGNVIEKVATSVHHDGDTLLITLKFA